MTPTLSTPALVLHTTEYSETSVIAKVFTRQLGVRSYILKGVRKGGGRTKRNLLQPLSYLDMVVYVNPKTTLNYVKELAPHTPTFTHSDTQAINNAVVFFMTELLYKTLREEEPDQELFDYIVGALEQLRQPLPAMHAQMPLLFLLRLTRYLGLWPRDNYSPREPLFDLQEGCYKSVGETTIDPATSLLLHEYLQVSALPNLEANSRYPQTTLAQRTALMNRLIEYLQLHLDGFRSFHSHEILHTILN
ncbi:MAG: DNA repair protein RecO [Bacteroidales bacterium]|nr:DNA repair protein RecO [Bacteroidales bacterium]